MRVFLVLIFLVGLSGCFLVGKKVNLNEEFTLKKNETVSVEGTNLQLKMLVNGHNWLVGGGHTYFCEFEVSFDGKTEKRGLNTGESKTVADLNIKLQGIDETPNHKEKDPWSNTSCKFIVTKNIR